MFFCILFRDIILVKLHSFITAINLAINELIDYSANAMVPQNRSVLYFKY